MKKLLMILVAVLTAAFSQISFARTEWYKTGRTVDTSLVDVIYIVSTNVVSARDGHGHKSYRAGLTRQDRRYMDMEIAHMSRAFGDSVNFFSPYYHQYTLEAAALSASEFNAVNKEVTEELYDIFDDYVKNLNGGRKFVLAGFSQGAMHCLSLVKKMTSEQYSRLIAVYMMGYRLNEEDLGHPQVAAADGPDGQGVTISFNSVMDTSAIWPAVTEGAATCINPLNWRTDETAATLDFYGDIAEVSVDTVANVLVVKGLDTKKYIFKPLAGYVRPGNLHHWDILFYTDAIRENILHRAYGR